MHKLDEETLILKKQGVEMKYMIFVILFVCLLLTCNCMPITDDELSEGLDLFCEEKPEDALKFFDEFIEELPIVGLSFYMKSLILRNMGNYDLALSNIEKSLCREDSLDFDSYYYYNLEFKLKLNMMTYADALIEIDKISSQRSNISYLAKIVLTKIYIDNNDFEKALSMIEARLSSYQDDILAIALKGLVYLKMNDTKTFWNCWKIIYENISIYRIYSVYELNHAITMTHEFIDSKEFPLFASYLIARIMKQENSEVYFQTDIERLNEHKIDLNEYISEHIPLLFHDLLLHNN